MIPATHEKGYGYKENRKNGGKLLDYENLLKTECFSDMAASRE